MKPNFLFHCPGCRDLYDQQGHEFPYKSNWLTKEELTDLPERNAPKEVEVIQVCGNNTSRKLGRMATATALLKFSD